VDIILRKGSNDILMEKRAFDPFKGLYALPGGHVDYGETVEHAVLRELREECSLSGKLITILGVYSNPERDPRGQRISTVFIADWEGGEPKAGDDAAFAEWVRLDEILERKEEIAFDHGLMLQHFKKWLEGPKSRDTFWSSKQ